MNFTYKLRRGIDGIEQNTSAIMTNINEINRIAGKCQKLNVGVLT